ncbi:MAG: RICIN domain-containing protein [Actinomycetota bacterium]
MLLTASLAFAFAADANGPNATIVVDSTGDQDDTDPLDGVCATASQGCTLRAAMTQANNNNGPDTINFNIPGTGIQTIALGSELPTINDPSGGVTIDGYTQPGASPNTDPLIFNATILIDIDGPSGRSFLIQSAENTLRGLAIYGAGTNIELTGENADGNVFIGNMIGTDAANTHNQGSGIGLIMNLGPDQNTIGTPDLADRNVISGSGSYGIRINHGETSQNIIQNNIIGLDATGQFNRGHAIGVDLQWFTWRNQVGGLGPNEGNVMSGNRSAGMDFSHSSVGNSVLGNLIGTHPDGSISTESANRWGVIFKDDPNRNYTAYNVIANSTSHGVWHKQNYTAGNTIAHNEIVDNAGYGVFVTGHDDVYFDNIIARNGLGVSNINNTSTRNNSNFPDELTERNAFRLGHIYDNGGIFALLDSEAHPNADQPTLTGIETGAVYGGGTCAGCTIDIYVSGSVNGDGTVTAGSSGATGIVLANGNSDLCVEVAGSSTADGAAVEQATCTGGDNQNLELVPSGTGFALMAAHSSKCLGIPGGSTSGNVAVAQETCDGSDSQQVQWSGDTLVFAHSGLCLDIDLGSNSAGAQVEQNACSGELRQVFYPGNSIASTWLGTVTADAAGDFSMASATLQPGVVAWAVSLTGGSETAPASGHLIVGGSPINPGTNPSAPEAQPADPTPNALPAPYVPETFECSHAGTTLSWDDAGASAYYVFATTGGTEIYLGPQTGTSLTVDGADSYRVTHWAKGFATTALCDGPGPDLPDTFECSYDNGTLSWDDAGASTYYVFAEFDASNDVYLGGLTTTSVQAIAADSYRVTHWLGGQTVATCDGPGPAPPDTFECSYNNGTLSWDDAGATAYFVFATSNGVDTYLGGFSSTSIPADAADSYRVTHWLGGQTVATCAGPGAEPPFSCSVTGTTLTWDNAGASAYYVFAEYDNADDVYLGGHAGTSLTVPVADSYRVTHWLGGQTVASCSP